jgi:hypothetical protein
MFTPSHDLSPSRTPRVDWTHLLAFALGAAATAVGLAWQRHRLAAPAAKPMPAPAEDTWVAHELAVLLAATGSYNVPRFEAVILGHVIDRDILVWLEREGAGAELTYRSVDARSAREDLRAFHHGGERMASRTRPLDAIPAALRGRLQQGEAEITVPWDAPWRAPRER